MRMLRVRCIQLDIPQDSSLETITEIQGAQRFPGVGSLILNPDFVSLAYIVGGRQVIIEVTEEEKNATG